MDSVRTMYIRTWVGYNVQGSIIRPW